MLTILFVLNPLILLFGGNGMSEATYLFAMVAATRYLLRWLRNHDRSSLLYCAIALAFGYLERSEPVAAAVLAAPSCSGPPSAIRTGTDAAVPGRALSMRRYCLRRS